ncbi:heavy metal translocating P-type ATPase [Corynebacterium pacaense]|uniref:heavy metal translocating P-type ATPase n=1 Tax=Corynebacterium pacaense TaxID=1816684 RepID=UPI0009BB2E65|nr:cation-translocating P-type ATPase [Corynebacterium pacaense]
MPDQDHVDHAISDAKVAALRAGVGAHTGDDELEAEGRHRSSLSFELEGLKGAPSVAAIKADLEKIPGVSATVVYPTSMAWVTANDRVDPEMLIHVFAAHGVRAHLTPGSLLRRSHRLNMEADREARVERFRRRAKSRSVSPRVRRHAREEHIAALRARESGWISATSDQREQLRTSSGDVLFTARALITPLRLVLCLPPALAVLLISYVSSWQFDYWQWVVAALALPVVTWGAWPFHRAAAGGLRRGISALDAAGSGAVILAYLWSLAMLLLTAAGEPGWRSQPQWFAFSQGGIAQNEVFFDVACGITVILLAGRLLTRRSSQSRLLTELDAAKVDPQHVVTVVRRDRSRALTLRLDIPVSEVRVNDDVIVPPGARVPVDGQIIGGGTTIEASIIMGQDRRKVKVNDPVYAGGVNLDSEIKVRALRTGHNTRIAAVRRWVTEAMARENRHNRASLKSAGSLVPAAFILAVVDFCLWALISGNINAGFTTALAVLACVGPVALALSTALATRNTIEAAARHGMLIRSGEVFRVLDDVDTAIFNRLGTLTDGGMTVETITADKGEDAELVLRVAGALSMESNHAVSQALVKAAREARDFGTGGVQVPHWIDVGEVEITEDGAFKASVQIPLPDSDGTLHMRSVDAMLWRPRSMTEVRSSLSPRLAAAATSGGAPLVVRWKGKDRGVITLHDGVKPDADEAIKALEDLGIETIMLSRDTYPVSRRYADSLGITHVLAGIAPGKKSQSVRSVHTRGSTVAMIGDSSVMDCLRVADVGLLMGVDDPKDLRDDSDDPAADVVLMRPQVMAVPLIFKLARRYVRLVNGNIGFAWAYNAVAVVLAVSGLLHPMAATVVMLGSSLLIEWRSLRARRL